jgi:RHS repeat-associated protein
LVVLLVLSYRTAKIAKPNALDQTTWQSTHYVRDASGNVMAIYTENYEEDGEWQSQLALSEIPLYGSSRMGIVKTTDVETREISLTSEGDNIFVSTDGTLISPSLVTDYISRTLGNKMYELSNHLGNVISTISDRKLAYGSSTVDYFNADVLSYSDYYPFGMTMPGRNANAGEYRHGYQGSEADEEIVNISESHITTHFRELDTRIARWWSSDPKSSVTPWESPYSSMATNPILYNDPNGDIFKVGKDEKSQNDVKSIVKQKYQGAIRFDDNGEVSIDFDQMKDNEDFKNKDGSFNQKKFDHFKKKGMQDIGIQTINLLSTAVNKDGVDEVYLYTSSYFVSGRSRLDPSIPVTRTHYPGEILDTRKNNYPQTNLSTTPHSKKDPGDLPMSGVDGQVNIPPGTFYNYYDDGKADGTLIKINRYLVVLHELREIYYRTHDKKDYDEAHKLSGGIGDLIKMVVE